MLNARENPAGGFVIEMVPDRALLLGPPLTDPGGQPMLPLQSGPNKGSPPPPIPPSSPKFSTAWGGNFPSPFYDWLATFVAGKATLKKIRILAVDYAGEPRVHLDLPTAQL